MRVNQLFMMAMVAIFIVACGQEAPPPPPPAPVPVAPQQVAPQPVAQAPAPAAPAIVYASAEPQHGGIRQKGGDYMVELATGAEGKVDAYIQKYEGDVPSFEDVQVEMQVKPKEGEEAIQETPNDVIFYPKEGKLEGTVAGLPKGAYDVVFKIFDIKDDKLSEVKFDKVEIDPLETELKPKHEGEVKVVDKTKMEVVRDGSRIKVWLRDLEDKKLKPAQAAISQMVVNLDDGSKEELEIEAKDDHFEAEVKGVINPELFKIMMAQLTVDGKEYPKLRVPRVAAPVIVKKGMKLAVPPMTTGDAKKKDKPGKMKGAIGTMAVGKKPPKKTGLKPGKFGPKPKLSPVGAKPMGVNKGKKSKKTKKGAMSKAKKVK